MTSPSVSIAPVTVAEAAARENVPVGTIKRWIREGAPCVRRGRRGRGQCALLNLQELRAWRVAQTGEALLLALASELPLLLADAATEALQAVDTMPKSKAAGLLAASWYVNATAVLDALRARCPLVPDITDLPEQVRRLQKIAR